MADKDIDLKKIKELIEIMKKNELLEIEIKQDDTKIFLKRGSPHSEQAGATALPTISMIHGPAQIAAPIQDNQIQPAATQPAANQSDTIEIKSPIVGTFYATPSPDSEPYIEIGSSVGPQTVVCIIEAMKVMNEIKAETSGTVTEILVTNGQAVEYGQALFRVRPD